MTQPLVSVVIATYNAGQYLAETIKSALAQTHPCSEVIVVDDGSTDDTAARIAPYRSGIRYMARDHGGLAAARNAGIAAARGEYIALLDADDLWEPDTIAVQLDVARRYPGAGLVACDGVQFEDQKALRRLLVGRTLVDLLDASPAGEVWGSFHAHFLEGNPISCPAQTLIPRDVLAAIGPFIDSGVQDYDYYLRIAQRFPVVAHRRCLVRWRYRRDSMSGPREGRTLVWNRMTLPVLKSHARRCNAAERRVIARRCRRLVRDVAYQTYRLGITGERPGATREIARLLWADPWPPTALPYLIGLQAPASLREVGRRAFHLLKRRS